MKRIKIFAAGAALLLTTVVVFARSPKFVDSYEIYGLTGTSTWTPMLGNQDLSFSEFQVGTSLTNPSKVTQGTKTYSLYYYDVTPGHVGPVDAINLQ